MTMPEERYRAIVWAREFMEELRTMESASPEIRRQALVILRHFPRNSDLNHPCLLLPNWIAAPTETKPTD